MKTNPVGLKNKANANPIETELKPKKTKGKESKEKEIKEKENKVNNITASEDKSSSASAKASKHRYGEYKNVLLKDEELQKLKEEYQNWEELIRYLDEYIEMKGYKAKSHYLCIKKWVIDAVKRESISKQQNNQGGMDDFKELMEEARLKDELSGNNTGNNTFSGQL